MINKFLKKLGYIPVEEYNQLTVTLDKMKVEKLILEQKRIPLPLVEVDMGDPSPSDMEERKAYVSQVAGFHHEILKDKIQSLVSNAYGQFEKIDRETFGLTQEQYDLFLKGTINGFWSLYEWGELMISEKVSYETDSDLLTDEEIQKLTDKISN